MLTVVGADQLPRPALAFLGDPLGPPARATADGPGALTPADAPLVDRTDDAPTGALVPERPADLVERRQTLRRRRDTLGVLALVFVATLLIGFIPGAAAAWIVAGLSGVATAAYVAMLVQLRRAAEEREQKLRYLRPAPHARPVGRRRRPAGRST